MKFSENLKITAEPLLKAQFEHPFVKGLGDGTLSMDKFRYYMIQDSIYIVDYARAMAWVATLLPDVKSIIAMLDAAKGSFNIELMLKEQYFSEFGITVEKAIQSERAPTCKSYIDHVFRYTRTGTLAQGMAAILPCGWFYIEIGRIFTENRAIPDNHRYKQWLETYAVPEFREMVNWWFDILDQAVGGITDAGLKEVKDIFFQSCRYEWKFWDMAWNLEKWEP